ncbi:hypothetical protein HOY82DRAFT_544325 [Tuber indicum]|nr:hypothetical protein HOY82DRAFT_544325 [Tuber indicum]
MGDDSRRYKRAGDSDCMPSSIFNNPHARVRVSGALQQVSVYSSGTGKCDPGFGGHKCLPTCTGLLGLIFVSSFLTPEVKFTGSGFSGSRRSVAGYINGGISGGEWEEKDESSVVHELGRLEPSGLEPRRSLGSSLLESLGGGGNLGRGRGNP